MDDESDDPGGAYDVDERGNFLFLAGDDLVEHLPESEYEPGEDSDEFLVAVCFDLRKLRLNIDTVRAWSNEDWEAAEAWINDTSGQIVKPRAIALAEDEYSAARKCRVCGCTDYFACPAGCFWVEPDLCSECTEESI